MSNSQGPCFCLKLRLTLDFESFVRFVRQATTLGSTAVVGLGLKVWGLGL